MKKSIKIKRRQRKGSISFNPDKQYVAVAVEEFLKKGGRISHIEVAERDTQDIIASGEGSLDADEFLLGI